MNNEVTFKTTVTPDFPSAWSLFKPSLQALKLNLQTFLGFVGLLGAAFVVLGAITLLAYRLISHSAGDVVLAVAVLAFIAFALVLSAAFGLTALHSARGRQVSMAEMWQASKPFIARYALFQVYFILMSCVGLLLFVVPYLFVLKRYLLTPYYLLDGNMSVIEAMKASTRDSKDADYKHAFWGLAGVTIFISIMYDLPVPVVGQVISICAAIAYACAPAVRYLEIQSVAAKLHVKPPKKVSSKAPTKAASSRKSDSSSKTSKAKKTS